MSSTSRNTHRHPYSTEDRIRQFLRDHPDGPVKIVVGFASVWGLAWLDDHTRGRPVHLLIGDVRKHRFSKADFVERKRALEFLRRRDVKITNWYRRHPQKSEAHMKSWLIESAGGPHVLTGSANLTRSGIQHNRELMVEPAPADIRYCVGEINDLLGKSRERGRERTYKDQIIEAISEGLPESEASNRPGCLSGFFGGLLGAGWFRQAGHAPQAPRKPVC